MRGRELNRSEQNEAKINGSKDHAQKNHCILLSSASWTPFGTPAIFKPVSASFVSCPDSCSHPFSESSSGEEKEGNKLHSEQKSFFFLSLVSNSALLKAYEKCVQSIVRLKFLC